MIVKRGQLVHLIHGRRYAFASGAALMKARKTFDIAVAVSEFMKNNKGKDTWDAVRFLDEQGYLGGFDFEEVFLGDIAAQATLQ